MSGFETRELKRPSGHVLPRRRPTRSGLVGRVPAPDSAPGHDATRPGAPARARPPAGHINRRFGTRVIAKADVRRVQEMGQRGHSDDDEVSALRAVPATPRGWPKPSRSTAWQRLRRTPDAPR